MGAIFKVPALIVYFIGGIWGLIVSLGIVIDHLGRLVGFLSLLVFPIPLYVAPLYAGFAESNWFPLMLVYGTTVVAAILYSIGAAIEGD